MELESSNKEYTNNIKTTKGNIVILPILVSSIPPTQKYKSCDIHININMNESSAISLYALECLGLAGFKRIKNSQVHNIITPTFESIEVGEKFFEFFVSYLNTLPNISANVKFEIITNHLRQPQSGRCLPLVTNQNAIAWFEESKKLLLSNSNLDLYSRYL